MANPREVQYCSDTAKPPRARLLDVAGDGDRTGTGADRMPALEQERARADATHLLRESRRLRRTEARRGRGDEGDDHECAAEHSTIVGALGKVSRRVAPVVASSRSLPALMCS